MSDADDIVYGRPRYLIIALSILLAAASVAAIASLLTYSRVNTASKDDVLGNRSVLEKIAANEDRREAEEQAHRQRNEQAHACIIFNQVKILRHWGEHVEVTFTNPDPCAAYTRPGEVPPLPTTTTTPRRPTSTTTRRTTTTTTPTTRPVSSTHPTTTTTTCTAKVRGRCLR